MGNLLWYNCESLLKTEAKEKRKKEWRHIWEIKGTDDLLSMGDKKKGIE